MRPVEVAPPPDVGSLLSRCSNLSINRCPARGQVGRSQPPEGCRHDRVGDPAGAGRRGDREPPVRRLRGSQRPGDRGPGREQPEPGLLPLRLGRRAAARGARRGERRGGWQRYSAAVEGVASPAELVAVATEIFREDLDEGYVTVLVEMIAGAASSPGARRAGRAAGSRRGATFADRPIAAGARRLAARVARPGRRRRARGGRAVPGHGDAQPPRRRPRRRARRCSIRPRRFAALVRRHRPEAR